MLGKQDDLNLVQTHLSEMLEIREFSEYRCWRDSLALGKKDVLFTWWVPDLGLFLPLPPYDHFHLSSVRSFHVSFTGVWSCVHFRHILHTDTNFLLYTLWQVRNAATRWWSTQFGCPKRHRWVLSGTPNDNVLLFLLIRPWTFQASFKKF